MGGNHGSEAPPAIEDLAATDGASLQRRLLPEADGAEGAPLYLCNGCGITALHREEGVLAEVQFMNWHDVPVVELHYQQVTVHTPDFA